MALIELQDIDKRYGLRDVLRKVNLWLEGGEFVSIVGASASGKTTLLKIAAGLLAPGGGAVLIEGRPVTGFPRKASIVFQNYSLLPWLSAVENVLLAVESAFPDWPKTKQKDQAVKYLGMVGLGAALAKRPSQLSGGMRQRVAIARAFATEPAILFLDEPFGALDALTRSSLQQELSRLCTAPDRPVTVVMITNSVEEAILLADRIVPMTRGPRATLGSPIAVGLPRPRASDLLLHDGEAIRVRARVVEALTSAVASPPPVNARPSTSRTADAD